MMIMIYTTLLWYDHVGLSFLFPSLHDPGFSSMMPVVSSSFMIPIHSDVMTLPPFFIKPAHIRASLYVFFLWMPLAHFPFGIAWELIIANRL